MKKKKPSPENKETEEKIVSEETGKKESPEETGGKKRFHLGVREFWKSRSGRNFLLVMEAFLAAGFFAQPHLYYNGNISNFMQRFYADSLSICGGLFAILVFLTVKPIEFKEKTNRILNHILCFAMPFFAFLWLELYNHAQFWVPLLRIPAGYLALDLALYYAIFLVLLLIFNSARNASLMMVFLTAFFGFFNYELTVWRSMSFIASDIYSVGTALSVANTYQLQMDVDSAEFLMLAIVMMAAILKLKSVPLFERKSFCLAHLAFCAALWAVVCQVYVYSPFLSRIGVDFRVYRPQYKYRFYGTLLTTIRTFGYLHVSEPEGYSAEAVREIIQRNGNSGEGEETEEETSDLKPNIIVVMNESFADLKTLGDLKLSKDYMPYFRKLKNTIRGNTYTSVFGGNTANSEFEFLTGNSLAFLPDNSVPYQLFLRSPVAGLTQMLKDQGYSPAYALHPYYNTGYSRYKVYPLMGFDHFYTSDDFSVFTDTVNYHITDEEDYRKIIDLYEKNRNEDSPFYLFNVTMQNHGSYDGTLYETGNEIQIEGSLSYYSRVEQYLNMIKMSDEALKYLVEYFEKVEEPTIILFFGDHQPDLDEEFYNALLGKEISELEGEELEKLYQVPFLIWANYDIEDRVVERTSNNYLFTYLMEISGVRTTGYLDYLRKLREDIPCINALGYWGSDGKYYELEDETSPYFQKLQEYRLLQYNNIFGKDEQVTSFFRLGENEGN